MCSKRYIFSIFLVCILLMYTGCQSDDFVKNPASPENYTVEITVNTPDEMKTRASVDDYPSATNCDKLWYAVYYNNSLLYDCTDADAPQATQSGDKFTLLLRFAKNLDASKVKIFFWAGHSTDDVSAGANPSGGSVKLNFGDRYVDIDPGYLWNNKSLVHSYTNYIQLSTTSSPSSYSFSVLLKRPFASFTVLMSQITGTHSSGIDIKAGFLTSGTSNPVMPYRWWFDDSLQSTPAKSRGDFLLSSYSSNQHNSLNTSVDPLINYTVEGQSRQFVNCGNFYFLAPMNKGFWNNSYNRICIDFYDSASGSNFDTEIVDLPTGGIQANNKYILYENMITLDFTLSTIGEFEDTDYSLE